METYIMRVVIQDNYDKMCKWAANYIAQKIKNHKEDRPFVLGLLWRKVSRPAVWTSVIGALVLTVVLIFVFGYDKNGWDCTLSVALKDGVSTSPLIGTICMIYSLVSTFVVSLFTKSPSDDIIKNAFEKPIQGEIN